MASPKMVLPRLLFPFRLSPSRTILNAAGAKGKEQQIIKTVLLFRFVYKNTAASEFFLKRIDSTTMQNLKLDLILG